MRRPHVGSHLSLQYLCDDTAHRMCTVTVGMCSAAMLRSRAVRSDSMCVMCVMCARPLVLTANSIFEGLCRSAQLLMWELQAGVCTSKLCQHLMDGTTTHPSHDAKPATRHECSQQGRQAGSAHPKAGTGKNGERDAVFAAGVSIQDERQQSDGITQNDCHHSLPA